MGESRRYNSKKESVPVNFAQCFGRDRLEPVRSDLHPCSCLTQPALMSRAPSCPGRERALWITPPLIRPNPQQPPPDCDGLQRGAERRPSASLENKQTKKKVWRGNAASLGFFVLAW